MATYTVPGEWDGMVAQGNIDLDNRPVVKTPTGGYATVRSASFGMPDGYEYLLPSVTQDGRMLWWGQTSLRNTRRRGSISESSKTHTLLTSTRKRYTRLRNDSTPLNLKT